MVPAIEDQKGAGNRRQEQQAILRKDIVVEQSSTFLLANTILTFLAVAVEGRQVDIRTCLILQPVLMIGPEARMDDECGKSV